MTAMELVDTIERLTHERDEARAAIAADLHRDECHAVATRATVDDPVLRDFACDEHGVGGGDWQDLPPAAAVRAAQVTP